MFSFLMVKVCIDPKFWIFFDTSNEMMRASMEIVHKQLSMPTWAKMAKCKCHLREPTDKSATPISDVKLYMNKKKR
jgi:hypothetical protein